MNIYQTTLKNEEGSAIVLALLALAILTILGVSSTDTSITELNIVRNEQIYQINFYQAESCANEAALYIEMESDPTKELTPAYTDFKWISDINDVNMPDLTKSGNWVDSGNNSNSAVSSVKNIDNSGYATVAKGPRPNTSVKVTTTRLYEFAIYGKSESLNGNSVVEIGYLRRY